MGIDQGTGEIMPEEDNGQQPEPEQPGPQPQPSLHMQLSPQGVVLSFPVTVNLAVDNETMEQLIQNYLQAHPDFQQKLIMELVAVKQQELKIIQMVNKSRID